MLLCAAEDVIVDYLRIVLGAVPSIYYVEDELVLFPGVHVLTEQNLLCNNARLLIDTSSWWNILAPFERAGEWTLGILEWSSLGVTRRSIIKKVTDASWGDSELKLRVLSLQGFDDDSISGNTLGAGVVEELLRCVVTGCGPEGEVVRESHLDDSI